jgi:hypothetical protein
MVSSSVIFTGDEMNKSGVFLDANPHKGSIDLTVKGEFWNIKVLTDVGRMKEFMDATNWERRYIFRIMGLDKKYIEPVKTSTNTSELLGLAEQYWQDTKDTLALFKDEVDNGVDFYVEVLNEPLGKTPEQHKNLSLFEMTIGDRRYQEWGMKSCLGNWNIGTPEVEDLIYYTEMFQFLEATNGLCGIHGGGVVWPWFYYGNNTHENMATKGVEHFPSYYAEGWLGFRYRKFHKRLKQLGFYNIRFIETEWAVDHIGKSEDQKNLVRQLCGYDAGPWKTCKQAWAINNQITDDARFYAHTYLWDMTQKNLDPYHLGSCIFKWGTQDWEDWDIQGNVVEYLATEVPKYSVPTIQTDILIGTALRTGPSLAHPVRKRTKPGERVEIVDLYEGWSRVKTNDGYLGWMKNE